LAKTRIITLDLIFQGKEQAIAAYLIKFNDGVILIESGPGSTIPRLQAGLAAYGLAVADVTHVLLTHIHLDHAGAAGFLARQGAQIFVHPIGAPHMISPEKLLASAKRIYGDRMDTLWGEFLPVPEDNLRVLQDGEEIMIGNLGFVAVNTPGHAEHHYAYLFEDICFSGDACGVRIPGFPYMRVPMPPPELHLERWRTSIQRLQNLDFKRIAPTHFGIFDDPKWQLDEMLKGLDNASQWLDEVMVDAPSVEDLRELFTNFIENQGRAAGLSEGVIQSYSLANPLGMSADGLYRYWSKYRDR
jgi:glyoxylase-like metal-dependent hydrolase (beta-lactamase superfamily II)